MLKLVLVVLLVVLVVGFVAGAMAVTSIKDARDQRLRHQLAAYKLEVKAQERQRRLAQRLRENPRAQAQSIPSLGGKVKPPERSTVKKAAQTNGQPSSARTAAASQDRPRTAAPKGPPKQTGFATLPPASDFIPLCECPHCGWLDTHFLRVPVHQPPLAPDSEPAPQPQPEMSWWEVVTGWFEDEKTDVPEEPTRQEGQPEKSWWDSFVGWFGDDAKPQDSTRKPDPVLEPTADHPDARVVRTCRNCGHVWAQR